MPTNPLSALASRIEQASGPDRDLDHAIMEALGIGAYRTKNGLLGYPLEAKPYTASLDAAMTLVPEGCGSIYKRGSKAGWWGVQIYTLDKHRYSTGDAVTEALALTAAALRARVSLGTPPQ